MQPFLGPDLFPSPSAYDRQPQPLPAPLCLMGMVRAAGPQLGPRAVGPSWIRIAPLRAIPGPPPDDRPHLHRFDPVAGKMF